MYLDSGCSTVVAHALLKRKFMGSNPAQLGAFFFLPFKLSFSFIQSILTQVLQDVHLYVM